MLDREGSKMSSAGSPGARGARRSRRSRFHDRDQDGPGTLPVGKISRRTPAKPSNLQQARRFGLLLDRSVPAPVPGPLLSPLIGGLPGSSLLIGQQAACLQLARIKTQLALTQISSTLAAGSRAFASRTVSNTPPFFVSTSAPSPTAAAINLLNLLKVANMSHNLYNPYSPESQDSSSGAYKPPSAQVGPGNVGEPSHLVPGSTHASYGASSGTSMNPSHIHPSMHPGSMGYIPDQSKPTTELESAIDVHIKQAREEVSLQSILKKPPLDQNTRLTAWPEVSLALGSDGYISSTPVVQGQFSGYSNTMAGGTANWPSSYQTSSSEASCNVYASSSSSSLSAPNIPPSNFSQSSLYSSGDVGNYGSSNKPSSTAAGPALSTLQSGEYESRNAEYSQAGYTCESAMDILKRFNLQEEDLEELCAYTEDQLSPANLPYLLRDIRQKKAKRSSSASQSSMVHHAQGSQRITETTAGPRANVKREEEVPPAFQQPSKVIEYGHTSKYTGGFREEDEGRGHHNGSVRPSSFSESGLMDSYTSQSRETLPKDVALGKCGVPVSSHGSQRSNSSPVYSPLPNMTASPSQKLTTQSIQTASPSLKKEPVASQSTAPVAKPVTTNPIPKRDLSADRAPSAASQRLAPGAGTTNHRPAPGAGTTNHKPAPETRTTNHRSASEAGTTSHRPAPGVGTTSHRPAPGIGTTSHKPAPGIGTTSHRPPPGVGTTSHRPPPGVGTTSHRPPPVEGTTSHRPAPGTGPGAVPSPKSISINQVPPPASDASLQRPPPAKPAGKRTPTAAMISDYMGVTPKLFPHTCCLCNKPCVGVKDWLDHRKHIVHLASCRLLCRQYSEWEPDTVTLHLAPEESQQPPAATTSSSSQRSNPSLQATSHGGPAPLNSTSPLPSFHGSKSTSSVDRKTSETRKSRSPQRKRSRSKSSGRKRSRSSGRKRSRSSGRKRSRSKSSGRKSSWSRSSGRKRSRSKSSGRKRWWSPSLQSPHWMHPTGKAISPHSSRHIYSRRSHSRSRSLSNSSSSSYRYHGKRSSSPARRSRQWSGSPRRGRGSRSPQDSRPTRWSPCSARQSRRSRSGSPSSHPSSQRRRSRSHSRDRSSDRRQEETSIEQLAKKLLETSGVQTSTGSTSLEVVVQSLAPMLLAEMAKLKSSSSASSSPKDQRKPSSSSSSRDEKKPSSSSSRDEPKQSSSTKRGKEPPLSSSSSSVQGIKKVKKSVPTKSAKPQGSGLLDFVPAHPPLLLSGLPSTVTQAQVFSAVEKFGKSRLISVAQNQQEATVYFLQATAAQALLGFTELKIGGNPITVTQNMVPISPQRKGKEASTKPASKVQPGNKTATPGNETATPGNEMATPGNETATPGNETATPGNETATPGNETATPGNETATPGNETATPVTTAATPGNKKTTPGNKKTTPGNKKTTPGNKKTTPGNAATTLGNQTATPGNKTSTAISTNMSINTIISSRPDTTPAMPLMFLPPATPPGPPQISTIKSIVCMDVRSGKLADFEPDATPPKPLMYRPPVATPPPPAQTLPTTLFLKSIECIDVRSWTLADFQPYITSGATIMVTDLPEKVGFHHRAVEIIHLLEKFGNTECDKCFILPDNCTAFVEMAADKMEQLMDALTNGVLMNSGIVHCHLLKENALGSPITFYQQLLKWSGKVYDETSLEYKLVYISNFPNDKVHRLKAFQDVISKTGGVRLYLLLMGKIFLEFNTVEDADRFGVWLSSFPKIRKEVHVTRPGIVIDTEAITPVCTTMRHKPFLEGCDPPFWLAVPTLPYFYPTLSPQFYTPAHRTVKGPQDVEWAKINLIEHSVIMVTGLPLGGYSHMDLLRNVWPYFVEKNISRVFYYVLILPLQRRAFIYFDDSLKCKEFVSAHLNKPFTLGGCDLTLHFLLEHLTPCTTEAQLYNQLLKWSNVVPKERVRKDRLLLTAVHNCSVKALKFIFYVMKKTSYLSCIVLANRVFFQIHHKANMYHVISKLIKENNKLVGDRTALFPKPYYFQSRQQFVGTNFLTRKFKNLFKHPYIAAPTMSGQSSPHPLAPGPLAPGPSGAALPTYTLTTTTPADSSASAHDQAGFLGSGPKPPVLSQEMFHFFATAIRQHRHARVGQEVSQEKETSSVEGSSLSQHGGRSQRSPLFSSSTTSSPLSQRNRADGRPLPKRERLEQEETMEDKFIPLDDITNMVAPIVISSTKSCHSEGSLAKPSDITKEEEVPSDQQAPEEMPKTSSSSTSRGVKSNSSTTAQSSSSSKATVSSYDRPKTSSSSSLPPPVGIVPSSSEQSTPQKKCEESPAQMSEANDETYPTSLPSQEVTCITTTEEAESLPPCQPITKDEPPREAAIVCKGDVARHAHKMAAETSAVKSAESLTEKETLYTDPSMEEEGERQAIEAQQELTLPGKDMLVSSTEDMKENRVEVDETHQQMGDGKTSDHVLHSAPECGEETQYQTLVQPETPGLPDPESQTPELQEVTEDTETVLEEEKMTVGEEQMPSADDDIPTVVSDAAEMLPDAIFNGTSTEEDDTHQLMDCVEGSLPKEDTNAEQSNKEPTEEEVAPEMDHGRSKRGHPSPATKLPSTRRSSRHSTPTKKDPVEVEEADYQILDSVEEDPSSNTGGRSPPSGALMPQGQAQPEEDEGEYQVANSVEGEVAEDEGVQLPTRRPTTRGKRGKPPKQMAKNVVVKKEQPTAPVREEAGRKPHEPVENQDSPTRTETQSQEVPEPISHIDPVEGEPNMEEPTNKEESRGKEGGAEGTKMADKVTPRDAKPRESGEGVTLEEVATYQVLDSVEEEEELEMPSVMKGTRGRGRKGGKGHKAAKAPTKDYKLNVEETMFEVLDAIGGDAVEEAPAAEHLGRPQRGLAKKDLTPAGDGKITHNNTPEGTQAKQDQDEKEEKVVRPVVDFEKQESLGDDQTSPGRRGRRRKEEVAVSGTSKMATKKDQQMGQDLVEEVYQVVDFIEDKSHEEEEHVNSSGLMRRSIRRRETAPAKTRATRTLKSTQGEEPMYQVVDSVGGEEEQVPEEPVRGKRGCEVTRRDAKTEEKATKKKKTTEQNVPPEGDEDGGEEKETYAVEKERKVGAEMERLVTLDEVGEEEQEGKEPMLAKHLPPLPDDQSQARLDAESVVSFDQMVRDEGMESSSIAGQRKQSEEQTVKRCTRGVAQQAKPSGRQAPPTPLHTTSLLASKPGTVLINRGAEPMAESPTQDGEETGVEKRREGRKASSKARREEEGAEPKRVCSLSPNVSNDYTLPPFTPHNPLGVDHVVPKAGFYCNLCSLFYEDETRARNLHCSSLGHYMNLKKYYQRLQEEQSRSQSGDSAPGHAPK